MITKTDVKVFKKFFEGNANNYVENNLPETVPNDGKKVKTEIYFKYDTPVTEELFASHLEGGKGLGLCPIFEANKCFYGVLDIDVYGEHVKNIISTLIKYEIPLIPFTSKSGGLHLYLRSKCKVQAKSMRNMLMKIADALSLEDLYKDKVEYFPKQDMLSATNHGSMVTLPYFNAENAYQTMLDASGSPVPFSEAMKLLNTKYTTLEAINTALLKLPYQDAPPCIQKLLIANNFPENSGRNNFLYSVSIYLKKKLGDNFGKEVHRLNMNMPSPLDNLEVDQIINSVQTSEGYYKCHDIPLKNYCDKRECAKREFGLGKQKGHFSNIDFGQLKKINTADPYYIWSLRVKDSDLPYVDVRFQDEATLLDQKKFQAMCIRYLHCAPVRIKDENWMDVLNLALESMTEVEVKKETDTSDFAGVFSSFIKYLVKKHSFENVNYQIHVGMTIKKDNRYYFTHEGLLQYFTSIKLRLPDRPLRDILLYFECKEDEFNYMTPAGRKVSISCWSRAVDNNILEEEGYYDAVYEGDKKLLDELELGEDAQQKSEEKEIVDYGDVSSPVITDAEEEALGEQFDEDF